MLQNLLFFWLRLMMAVKHGWLFNSVAAVELLTQSLVHVIVNLAFVSLLSKYKYSFFLCRVCHSFVMSLSLQPAARREPSEWPQHKTSVPSAYYNHGYYIWVNFFFPDAKYVWKVLRFILFFRTLGQRCLVTLSQLICWHWLCVTPSCFFSRGEGFCHTLCSLSCELWGICIQASWWSFVCGRTETTLTASTWFLLPGCPEQCPATCAEPKYFLFYADRWILVDPVAA